MHKITAAFSYNRVCIKRVHLSNTDSFALHPLTLGSDRSFTSGTTTRLGHAGGGPELFVAWAVHSTDARLGAFSVCPTTVLRVEAEELLSPSILLDNGSLFTICAGLLYDMHTELMQISFVAVARTALSTTHLLFLDGTP